MTAAKKPTPEPGDYLTEVTYDPTLGRKPYVVTSWVWRKGYGESSERDWRQPYDVEPKQFFKHLWDAVQASAKVRAENDYRIAAERLSESVTQVLL